MSEPHRLSYVGDPKLVEAYLEILARHNLAYSPDASASPLVEPGMDYDASDPFSIVVTGSYDTAETDTAETDTAEADIAHAIADFAAQFAGRAHIADGGAMPSGGVLTFRGRHELVEDLWVLLNLEQVEVLEPMEDDDWASVDEQIKADPAGDAAIQLQVLGWGDLHRPVAAATAAFLQRHPGDAQIDFDRDP